MSGLVDGILDQPGPSGTAEIARGPGADERAVGGAIAAALPAIVAGMATNTGRGDGSVIDDIIGGPSGR